MPEKTDLVVRGLGPGGLTAVLHAAANGKSVVGIGNRSDYVRGQRVFLTFEVMAFLNTHINSNDEKDLTFIEELRTGVTQIKNLERFLQRKIEQYPHAKLIILTGNDKTNLVKDTDGHHLLVQTSTGERRYPFIHLLAADGIKHQTANEVASIFQKPVPYHKSIYQPRHIYHGAVQLKLSQQALDHNTPDAPQRIQQQIKNSLKYMQYGWDMNKINDMPKCYIITNAKQTKFSFAGEIPDSIYHEPNEQVRQEMLKKWASMAILQEYGIPDNRLEFKTSRKHPQSHEKLKATTFSMEIHVANNAIIHLHDDHSLGVFAQIGDARRVPNYRLAHGANDAIESAICFVTCMGPNGAFDDTTYTTFIEKIDQRLDTSLQEEVMRGTTNLKRYRNKIATAIKEFIPILQAQQIDTNAFQTVKEGGFSLQNLVQVMHQMAEQIKTRPDLPQDVLDALNDKMDTIHEAIVQYATQTPDSIKLETALDDDITRVMPSLK